LEDTRSIHKNRLYFSENKLVVARGEVSGEMGKIDKGD